MTPMRSLAFKLTLAFLLVGLIGAMLMAFFLWQNTRSRFDQFVIARDRFSYANILAQHYQTNGNWDGVETVFGRGRFQAPGPYSRRAAIVLVDADGQVVFRQGDDREILQLLRYSHGRGVPIEVDGVVVGHLLSNPVIYQPLPGSPEADFLAGMTQAIALSALGATALALLLDCCWLEHLPVPFVSSRPPPEPWPKGTWDNRSRCAPRTRWANWPPRLTR